MKKYPLINDTQQLVSAKTKSGHSIQTYDDGFGPLFVWQDTLGNFGRVSGIVRAQTWEDAYAILEDEFFPAGDEDASEAQKEIEQCTDDEERNHLQACWDEAYGWRNSGSRRMPDGTLSMIYAKDLNGDRLDTLTHELLSQLEITLEITDES